MAKWHYTQNGQRVGPIDQPLLQGLVSSGHVLASEMAWRDGMPGWRAISTLPELAVQFAALPASAPYGYSGSYGEPAGGAGPAPTNDYTPRAPTDADYAGFWLRFGAYIIDQIIISVLYFFVALFVFGTESLNPNDPSTRIDILLSRLGLLLTTWLYYAIQESSSRRATFGKRLLGLAVVDMDGQRIGFIRASIRYFAQILSGLICGIGYLMAGFTEKKQALHDMIAGTYVVTTWS